MISEGHLRDILELSAMTSVHADPSAILRASLPLCSTVEVLL